MGLDDSRRGLLGVSTGTFKSPGKPPSCHQTLTTTLRSFNATKPRCPPSTESRRRDRPLSVRARAAPPRPAPRPLRDQRWNFGTGTGSQCGRCRASRRPLPGGRVRAWARILPGGLNTGSSSAHGSSVRSMKQRHATHGDGQPDVDTHIQKGHTQRGRRTRGSRSQPTVETVLDHRDNGDLLEQLDEAVPAATTSGTRSKVIRRSIASGGTISP